MVESESVSNEDMSTTEETAADPKKPEKVKKVKSKKAAEKNGPQRFEGGGVNFKAKLIGCEDVSQANGDQMCQEMIQSLKTSAKSTSGHKQPITVNVSLAGIKILEGKTAKVLHTHAVQRISFISRDVTDVRAFGYIYGPGDGKHMFFGIKTEKAAEGLVLTLRDLFQVVFEMKKKEVEEVKRQKELAAGQHGNTGNTVSSDPTTPPSHPNEPSLGDLLDLESDLRQIEEGMNMRVFVPASPGGASSGSSEPWSSGPATPRSQHSTSAPPFGDSPLPYSNGGAVPYPSGGVQSDKRPSLIEQVKELQQQAQVDPFTVHAAALPPVYQPVAPPTGAPGSPGGVPVSPSGAPSWQSRSVTLGVCPSPAAVPPPLAAPPGGPQRQHGGRSPGRYRQPEPSLSLPACGAEAGVGGVSWATFDAVPPAAPLASSSGLSFPSPPAFPNDPFQSPNAFDDRYAAFAKISPSTANPFTSAPPTPPLPPAAAEVATVGPDPFGDLQTIGEGRHRDEFFQTPVKPTLVQLGATAAPMTESHSNASLPEYVTAEALSVVVSDAPAVADPPPASAGVAASPPPADDNPPAFAPPPLPARPSVEEKPPPPPPRPTLHRQMTLPSLPARLTTPVKSAVLKRQATMPTEAPPPPPPPRTAIAPRFNPPAPRRDSATVLQSVTSQGRGALPMSLHRSTPSPGPCFMSPSQPSPPPALPAAMAPALTPTLAPVLSPSLALSGSDGSEMSRPDSRTAGKRRMASGGSVGSRSSADSQLSADPFAGVPLPHTRGQQQRAATAESCVGRPRPRPRSQTPSGQQLAEQRPADQSRPPPDQRASLLSVMSADPFADVDPFTDTFDDSDPFASELIAADPFTSDFTLAPPVFSTQVVTADSRSGRLSAASNPFTFAPYTVPPQEHNASNNSAVDEPVAAFTELSAGKTASPAPTTSLDAMVTAEAPVTATQTAPDKTAVMTPATHASEPMKAAGDATVLSSTSSKSYDSFASDSFFSDYIQNQLLSLSRPSLSPSQSPAPSAHVPARSPSTPRDSVDGPPDCVAIAPAPTADVAGSAGDGAHVPDENGDDVGERATEGSTGATEGSTGGAEKDHDTSSSSGISSEAPALDHCTPLPAPLPAAAPPAASTDDETDC